ncbi:MAG: PKD domain-containing protein [Isosphaeraceae bacterium]|nr:PKD domain-containing protein [Isosphaeraceae bacterium]
MTTFPRLSALPLSMVLAITVGQLATADDLTVLKPDEQPRTMLYRALEQQARERLDARRKEVASLKTAEAIRARGDRIRARFLEALGDLPEKTPLHARVVGSVPQKGYRIERVIYESRPGHHVTANLYLPEGTGPFPGVLVPCGHSENGKAAETYQSVAALLAKNGLAALCFDPIGQGERLQALDADGKAAIKGSTTEHTMAGIGALLVGRSAASYRIWDAIRSLDYLASRAEVDPKQLGCTGNSGGGTETAYLMALDDRVAVAAPSCYITSLERLFATIGPQDAEQNITGQVAFGMDHADYALMRAPRPTLVCVGTQDFFDIRGSWDTFRELKLAYGRFGYGERVDLFESDEPHGFTKPRREASVRWLRRWLLSKDEPTVESGSSLVPDAQLQCTESGQVLSALRGKSVFDLNAAREAELATQRAEYQAAHSRDELLAEVRRLIALPDAIKPAQVETRGVIKRSRYSIRQLVFTTEPGIAVPALLFDPSERLNRQSGGGLTVIATEVPGENLEPNGHAEWLASQGSPVLVVSLRGLGETTPDAKGSPFGADWKEAFLSLHLARPLLGQRVVDLLAVIGAMAPEFGDRMIVIGRGKAAPVALHAALFEARIKGLTLDGIVGSWSDIARGTASGDQLATIVPGALTRYDLPDLAALIAPRSLLIQHAQDPKGRPLSKQEMAVTYASAVKAFRLRGAERALTLVAGPRPSRMPLLRAVDLSVGERVELTLSDGTTATVKLLALDEQRDRIRQAVREATVKAEINGVVVTMASGNYNLPVPAGGVQVDCPVTGGYRANSGEDSWKLEKDARLRVWPAGSPWIEPGSFVYPLRQRWLASGTQMANEPVFVDGGEKPAVKKIYYHNGLDTGGAEGLVDVVAATDGMVVSVGTARLDGFEDTPAKPRYDVVYLLDDRGWFYRYSHLQTIDPAIKLGASVRMGQKIGVLGKEGGSGGWSHLHFEITSLQPSDHWGTQEGYAFLWQAMLREQKPEVVAVARPHRVTWAGEPVTLDGSKSWARSGVPASYEWTFSDGSTATGPKVERTYDRPGVYSEVLKVSDRQGHADYDFAVVQVLDRANPDRLPPTIHAAYAPTFGLRAGDPITFKVRTFRTTDGHETWDFGDGTPPVEVRSDGNAVPLAKDGYAVTQHRYEKPGHYLVRVSRSNQNGDTAIARLHVTVGEPSAR